MLAFLQYYNLYSDAKLCMDVLPTNQPVLGNVTLKHEYAFNSSSENSSISVYAAVSGNVLHIASDDYGTKIEARKWIGKGTTGGVYAEIPGEALCWHSWCPPVESLGDFIGIPTVIVLPSKFVLMYTIFLVPTLEERARDRVFYNGVWLMRTESLWVEVIEDSCGTLFAVLLVAIVGIVVFAPRKAATLQPEHQDLTQGHYILKIACTTQKCSNAYVRMVLPLRSTTWSSEKPGATKTGCSTKH